MRDGRRGFRPPDEADGPRLFIALPLPDQARRTIEALVASVRLAPEPGVGERRDPKDVRWVRMDGLHVTLRFLGPTEPDRIAAAQAAVEAAAAGSRPFELGLAGAGAFPDTARPRVLWLGLAHGLEPLADLTQRLARSLADEGWPHDDRPARPHLTLARSDGVASGALVAGRLIGAAATLDLRWTADRLVLFESQTGGGPARYIPRLDLPLTAGTESAP
ncbi:MAG TPA: RNA 2',3'-cyclic phosphodiesterase [Candidatus Limnocylindrales bacterium]|nr:RNA 2',3'-cyclic phosphodiesterase [Candidatus Limnocylindrales bacterium]